MFAPEVAAPAAEKLDPLHLMLDSSGVVLVVLVILVIASFAVWVIWILKWLQLGRLLKAQKQFEEEGQHVTRSAELVALALRHGDAPGARIVIDLGKRHQLPNLTPGILKAVGERALVNESQRANLLMPTLSSIASAGPFIGLFGTVWGIMDAFLAIGLAKSASLPVVAPAIGEALIATAFGLIAAIPATIAYNFVEQQLTDLLEEVEASGGTWLELLLADPATPIQSAFPAPAKKEAPAAY
ncbi:MAG: MotA/TolQ/ExbB proton channel family protein [Polyangiaceae bacterium]|nr:MotA/TolQ/ExbB proton channel family protein [Polyangiaceae bacterium]